MLFDQWMEKIWFKTPIVIFPQPQDVRILKVARRLTDTGLARALLLGNQFEIRSFAETQKIRLNGVSVRKPIHFTSFDHYCRDFRKQFAPEKKIPEIRQQLQQPTLFGLQMLWHQEAQLALLRPQAFKELLSQWSHLLTDGQHMLSSFSLVWHEQEKQLLAFADPYFYPRPTPEQLAEIAITTAKNFQKLSNQTARLAMLSFSTRGSASHPQIEVVRQALTIIRKKAPDLKVEGEIQFDAAFVPEVGRKKAPGNALNGKANVYIFPSLNAANIGLKIVQTLTPYQTLGPIIQGLKYPVQLIDDTVCEDGLFKQIIVALNLINA